MNVCRMLAIIFAGLLLLCILVGALFLSAPINHNAGVINNFVIHSNVLKKEMKCSIYLPHGYSNNVKYPALYIIHGWEGHGLSFVETLKFNRRADILINAGKIEPLVIVFPDVDHSFGLNSSEQYMQRNIGHERIDLGRYEDYICDELISYIDSCYSTISSKDGRFIGGISMGGYIALRTSFRHTDLFSKAGGHSPALWSHFKSDQWEKWIYPDQNARDQGDPVLIAKKKDLSGLKVFLDCGDKDNPDFIEGCQQLNTILDTRNFSVHLSIMPGGHDKTYWIGMEDKYLIFYAGVQNK